LSHWASSLGSPNHKTGENVMKEERWWERWQDREGKSCTTNSCPCDKPLMAPKKASWHQILSISNEKNLAFDVL
jgi:hypothetical protein